MPAARRQEASKFGQACCEQSLPTVRISSRSLLASACGTLASTWGAKPGRTVSAAAMNAATGDCGKSLDHDGPLSWAFAARRFVGWICYRRRFPAVFAKPENGFVPGRVLFRRPSADETLPCSHRKTRGPRNWFTGRSEIKSRPDGEPSPACRAARGGVGGIHAPYRALSRLIRPRHQRPSGRGPARRRPVRPPDRRHRRPSRQKAAVFDRGAAGDGPGGVRARSPPRPAARSTAPPTTI